MVYFGGTVWVSGDIVSPEEVNSEGDLDPRSSICV